MTNERAVEILNLDLDILGQYGCETVEAYKMAIQALEQQPSEDTEVIKVSKGAVKARTGRYVIYDVEWLKEHFYSTEEKIYGQPKQPCEDAVSRKLAIEHIKGCCEDDGLYCVDDGEIIINIIKALPSVTPKYTDEEIDKAQTVEQAYVDKMVELAVEETKRPKGKWIIKDGKEQGYDIAGVKTWYIQIMCNKCGFITTPIEGHMWQYHYCPRCGAEMGGADETN